MLIMIAQLLTSLLMLIGSHIFGRFLVGKIFGMRLGKFSGLMPKLVGELGQETHAVPKRGWHPVLLLAGGLAMNLVLGVILFAVCLRTYEKDYIPVAEMDKGIYAFSTGKEMGFQTGDKILTVNGKTPVRFKDAKGMNLFFGGDVEVERNGQKETITIADDAFEKLRGQSVMEPFNHQIKVWGVAEGSGAKEAGIEADDVFIAVNNEKIQNYDNLKSALEQNKNGSVKLTMERDGKNLDLTCKVNEKGKLGFAPIFDGKAVNTTQRYSLGSAVKYGAKEGWETMYHNASGLYKVFMGADSPATEAVQSPVGIARLYGNMWNWNRFLKLTGLLSFMLGGFLCIPLLIMTVIQVFSR